jgi:hypothetical protein
MKENPTLPGLQDSSYSNGHFTGKHKHICSPVNVFSPSNFALGILSSLAICSSTLMICAISLIIIFLLTRACL